MQCVGYDTIAPIETADVSQYDNLQPTRASPYMLVATPHCVVIEKLMQHKKDMRRYRLMQRDIKLRFLRNKLIAIAAITIKYDIL